MSNGSYCAHRYRGDEYCTACKLIEAEAERAELRERVAGLEAHVEQLTSLLDGQFVGQEYWGLAAFDSLLSERDFLRTALRKYGRHLDICYWDMLWVNKPCQCGLDAALKGEE